MKQIIIAPIQKNVIHGLIKTHGQAVLNPLPKRDDFEPLKNDEIDAIMKRHRLGALMPFKNGFLQGEHCFVSMHAREEQQGYLYGKMDHLGQMTGAHNAYIYPGAKMALVGQFKGNKMISAQEAYLQEARCENNQLSIQFSVMKSSPSFHFSQATNESLGDQPLLRDPYEDKTVKLAPSTVSGSGNGLFALRQIEANETVAFYNGLMTVGKTEYYQSMAFCENRVEGQSALEREQKCFKNRLGSTFGQTLDIPPWLDDLSVYNATLGHKVNHKFKKDANAKFSNMEHPRFGPIPTVVAKTLIPAGEEIFVDYGYSVDNSEVLRLAPWFKELHEKYKQQ